MKHFLLTLEEGAATLYFYQDESDKYRLFIEKANSFTELEKIRKEFQGPDGVIQTRFANKFRGILNLTFSDCRQNVDQLEFLPGEIQKAVFSYNLCKDPGHKKLMSGVSTVFKTKHRIGIRFSSSMTSFTMNQNQFGDKNLGSLFNSQSFGGGAFYQLQLSKAFRFQTGFDFFRTQGTSIPIKIDAEPSNPNSEGFITYSANLTQLMIPIDLIFTFRTNHKLQFFFSGGYTLIFPTNQTTAFSFAPSSYSPFYAKYYPDVMPIPESQWSGQNGYSIGLGAIQKIAKDREITFRVRYETNVMRFKHLIGPSLSLSGLGKYYTTSGSNYKMNYSVIEFSIAFSGLIGKN